jgi:phosphate transport system substrate-binding protein
MFPAPAVARRRPAAALAALAAGAGLVACGGSAASTGAAIALDGSSTVAPFSEAVAEEYRAEAPGSAVSVGTSGTGDGFEKLCRGEIDVAGASRPIADEERAACEAAGITVVELTVGLDGLAVVTSAGTDFVDCLSLDQLAGIFQEGGATRWDQVAPELPSEPISVFAPGTDSGTYDFFVEEVLGAPGEPGSLAARTGHTASEDDNTLVQGLAGERGSWGFIGLAYLGENVDRLRAIDVAGDDGDCIAPSPETVADGSYPLSRPLFLYVTHTALARPEVVDLLAFALAVAPELVTEVGYIAAPADRYAASRAALEEATA